MYVQALITLHACQHPVNKTGVAARRDALRSKQVRHLPPLGAKRPHPEALLCSTAVTCTTGRMWGGCSSFIRWEWEGYSVTTWEAVGQVVEAEELEGKLYAELEGLPKCGKQFVAAIRCILKRETRSVPPCSPHLQHCQQVQDSVRSSANTHHRPRLPSSLRGSYQHSVQQSCVFCTLWQIADLWRPVASRCCGLRIGEYVTGMLL